MKRSEFLDEIEAFLAEQGMARADFGIASLNDPNFLLELARGRNPRIDTVERVRRFMRGQREKNLGRMPKAMPVAVPSADRRE